MRTLLRHLTFILACVIGCSALAQNEVTIQGYVTPCVGVSYPVHIVIDQPQIDTTVYTSANCYYSFTFWPVQTQGSFTASTSCDGGLTWSSGTGAWTAFFPTADLNLSCTGGPCNLWAGIDTSNNTPWQVWCGAVTGNGTAPYSYNWTFSDGSVASQSSTTWILNAPGIYTVCLYVVDANGCAIDTCLSFVMDENGVMTTGSTFPCQPCVNVVQSTNGPAGPPIPWSIEAANCSSGGVAPIQYYYQWNTGETTQQITTTLAGMYEVCIYMLDANGCQTIACDSVWVDENGMIDTGNPGGCNAGFWVIQAYDTDPNDPNGVIPVPNLLWIWNLSTGSTGNYQFLWSFGDGTSSTDPFPTHVYANGGPYVLCLTIYDGNCTDTYCDSVSVDDDGMYTGIIQQENYERSGFTINVLNELPSGLSEEPALQELSLWPNPVSEAFNLSLQSSMSGRLQLSVIDLNGRVVAEMPAAVSHGMNRITVPVDGLNSGIYVVRLSAGENIMNFRFVKN